MMQFTKKRGSSRRVPSELLSVDLGFTGTKVLRVRKGKEGVAVVRADLLPTISLYGNGSRPPEQLMALRTLPKEMKSNYVTVAVSSEKAVVRLLSLPGQGQGSKTIEAHLREHAGLEGAYRLAYTASKVKSVARGKAEMKYLAVALPEQEAQSVLSLVPSGPPAPWSMELSGLGAMTAFLHGPGRENKNNAVAVMEAGARVTYVALFNKGNLALVRKFDFGCETLVAKVAEDMAVEREVAEGIIADGSFDISGCVRDVMGSFLRQLSISRDFVERQEKCRIGKLYLSGGVSLLPYWVDEIARGSKMDVACWDPFASVRVEPGAIPAALDGQRTRFAAALGAALGALEGEDQ